MVCCGTGRPMASFASAQPAALSRRFISRTTQYRTGSALLSARSRRAGWQNAEPGCLYARRRRARRATSRATSSADFPSTRPTFPCAASFISPSARACSWGRSTSISSTIQCSPWTSSPVSGPPTQTLNEELGVLNPALSDRRPAFRPAHHQSAVLILVSPALIHCRLRRASLGPNLKKVFCLGQFGSPSGIPT